MNIVEEDITPHSLSGYIQAPRICDDLFVDGSRKRPLMGRLSRGVPHRRTSTHSTHYRIHNNLTKPRGLLDRSVTCCVCMSMAARRGGYP